MSFKKEIQIIQICYIIILFLFLIIIALSVIIFEDYCSNEEYNYEEQYWNIDGTLYSKEKYTFFEAWNKEIGGDIYGKCKIRNGD